MPSPGMPSPGMPSPGMPSPGMPNPGMPRPSPVPEIPIAPPNMVGPGGEVALVNDELYYSGSTNPNLDPDEALHRLLNGNRRFYHGAMQHQDQNMNRVARTACSESPFACVFTCSDSRVSPEIIFDEGIGNIFVVRNAGNVLDDHVIASIEYAVQRLNVPLIIVMGHTKCGSVTAAVDGVDIGGKIQTISEALLDAVDKARDMRGDTVYNATKLNVKLTAHAIYNMEPIIAPLAKTGRIKIYAACYDTGSGRVEFLDDGKKRE